MYENYLKYSGNRCKLSLPMWRQSSQMLLFSAEDLNLDAFSGEATALSLTIEFETERLATDASVPSRMFAREDDFTNAYAGGVNFGKNTLSTQLVARLVMIQNEQITIFDGGCEKQSIYWDGETAKAASKASVQQGTAHSNGPPKGLSAFS